MAQSAIFYDKVNYGGSKILRTTGATNIPQLNKVSPNLKNDIGSFQVMEGFLVELYDQENFKGTKSSTLGPAFVPDTQTINMKNKASSLKVIPAPPPARTVPAIQPPFNIDFAAVYQGQNLQGIGKNITTLNTPTPTVFGSGLNQTGGQSYKINDGFAAVFGVGAYPNVATIKDYVSKVGPAQGNIVDLLNVSYTPYINNITVNTIEQFNANQAPSQLSKLAATAYSKEDGKNTHAGNSFTMTQDQQVPDLSQVRFNGVNWNNEIQAIDVYPGYSITLYKGKNYQSPSVTIQGPAYIPYLGRNAQNNTMANSVQSFKVSGFQPNNYANQPTIDVSVYQTSRNVNYPRKNCVAGDWYDSTNKECRGIDASTCNLSIKPYNTKWMNPPPNTSGTSAPIVCQYPINQVLNNASTNDINSLLTGDWVDKTSVLKQADANIMPSYCSQQVTTCPIGPSGKKMDKCSRFVSTADDGRVCRNWVNIGRTNKNIGTSNADNAMIKYCNNFNTDDCSCLNRKNDKNYKKLMTSTQGSQTVDRFGNVQCWWKPCMSKGNLSDTLVTNDIAQPCTSNISVCQQITQIKAQIANVNDNTFTGNIDCTFDNSGPTGPTGGQTGPVGPTGPIDGGQTGPTGLDNGGGDISGPTGDNGGGTITPPSQGIPWWYYAIGIGLLILLLIIIGIIIYFVVKKR